MGGGLFWTELVINLWCFFLFNILRMNNSCQNISLAETNALWDVRRQWNLCEMFTKWRSDTNMFSFDNFASVKICKMWRSAHKMQKWQFAVQTVLYCSTLTLDTVVVQCTTVVLLQCPRSGCFPPNVRQVGICKIWSVDNIQWRSWPLGVLSFQSTPCMGGKKMLEIKIRFFCD